MMSPKAARTASVAPSPNQPHPMATPAPAAGISEPSVTMLGVIRRAAMNEIIGSMIQ